MTERSSMQVLPISLNRTNINSKNQSFGHGSSCNENNYTLGQKAVIAGTTMLGVAASSAILAKRAGYSLSPSKMFKNIKNSYLSKVKYHDKEVITIGAGSCLGGLAGGYLVDKDSNSRKAKNREALMQIGNVAIPILTVEGFSKIGEKYGKSAQAISAISGILVGVYLANFLMNILSNVIFNSKDNSRGVKITDFSAHLDDAVVAANYISTSDLVHAIARIIPVALMFAGNEVGNKVNNTNNPE